MSLMLRFTKNSDTSRSDNCLILLFAFVVSFLFILSFGLNSFSALRFLDFSWNSLTHFFVFRRANFFYLWMSWTQKYFFVNFDNIFKSNIVIFVFAKEIQNYRIHNNRLSLTVSFIGFHRLGPLNFTYK